MAHGLDIMAIRIEHKGTVITTMVMRSQAWRAIVSPTRGKCSRMESVYRRTVWRGKGHMDAGDDFITSANPEERLVARAISPSSLAIREKPLDAEWL